jgi:hypothetical protein
MREARQAIVKDMVREVLQTVLDMKNQGPGAATPGGTEGKVLDGPTSDHQVSAIKLEHGIPVPQRSSTGRWKDVYDKMVPGDSFVTTQSEGRSFVYVADKHGGRTATRTIVEGKTRRMRVWLVAKKELAA